LPAVHEVAEGASDLRGQCDSVALDEQAKDGPDDDGFILRRGQKCGLAVRQRNSGVAERGDRRAVKSASDSVERRPDLGDVAIA